MVGHFEGNRGEEGGEGEGEGEGQGRERNRLKGVEELWDRVSEEDLVRDPCVAVMSEETEEGKKVGRNGGRKFVAVWERRDDPAWPG